MTAKTKHTHKQALALRRNARTLERAKAQIAKMPDGEPKRVCKMVVSTIKQIDKLVREYPQELEDAGLLG